MRPLILLLLGVACSQAQIFTMGVKGGMPLTDFMKTVHTGTLDFNAHTSPYLLGLTMEVQLPIKLRLELDGIYRHYNYSGVRNQYGVVTASSTKGNALEFPLLAKWRFGNKLAQPFVDGGVAWDTLRGLRQTLTTTVTKFNTTTTGVTSAPPERRRIGVVGFVAGAGVDIHALHFHFAPEIRITRWGAKHFVDSNGALSSNQYQAEVMMGLTF